MKKRRSNGTKTPAYQKQTPMPLVKPAKAKSEEKVFYLCDRRACARCSTVCSHTTEIRHAANFRVLEDGSVWENPQGGSDEFVMGVDLAEGTDFTAYGSGMQAPESEG